MKTCKAPGCRNRFCPARPLQSACSPECAIALVRHRREALDRSEARKMRLALKTLPQLKAELQTVVNAYIRERDKDQPCISCGATKAKQWHAGHFLTTGAHPGIIRFHPWNINRQCSQCNDHLSGNLLNYRKGIIARFGQERLDWLEGPHESPKITREWIESEKTRYRALLRDLQRESND